VFVRGDVRSRHLTNASLFSSLGCPGFSLDETLALAAKHDIGAGELRALGGTVELPAYFAEKFRTPEKLATRG
jgi:hypothetical protein